VPFNPRHQRPFKTPPRRGPPPPPPELEGEAGPLPLGESGAAATARWALVTEVEPVWCEKHPDRRGIAVIYIGQGQWGGLCEECRSRYPVPMVGRYAPPAPPPAPAVDEDEPPF
jgi:hypothetical protein